MATNSYNAFGPTRRPLATDGGRRLKTGATATMARPANMETAPDIAPLRKPEPRPVKHRYPYDVARVDREQKLNEQRRIRGRIVQKNRAKPPRVSQKNKPFVDTGSDSDADSIGSLDFTDFVQMFATDTPTPPPRQPAPAAMPTYTNPKPPITTDAPFSRMMRRATTLGLSDIVEKFTRASVNFATIDKSFDPDAPVKQTNS